MGAALELIHAVGPANIAARVEALTQQLINALTGLPVRTITPRAWRDRAGIVSFVPDGIPAETLRQRLLVEGIVCSARRDVLRISPHFYNTAEEIDELIAALRSILS